MNYRILQRLDATLRAIGPILGVRQRGDGGFEADLDASATDDQRAAVANAIAAFDPGDPAQAAWELSQARATAAADLTGRADRTGVAVRAAVSALWTSLNDIRQQVGLPRLTQDEILALVSQSLTAGGGDPLAT